MLLALWLGSMLATLVHADTPAELGIGTLGGRDRIVQVLPGQTLLEIAHQHRLGFEAVARLNPDVDPWIPKAGSFVRLPTRYIVPGVEPAGLVINVPEMRLYDFTVSPLEVFAVAIGDAEDPSLVGEFRIGEKRIDPAWRVPVSIQREKPHLPPVVEPGPDNPLGSRWMTIGTTSYGIHGTNLRWSIGRQATHGCVRMYEDEIQRLYERIPRGTRVQLLYEPYKWGLDDQGRLYLEAHPDVYGREPDRAWEVLDVPRALGLIRHVDLERVLEVLDQALGMPVEVGYLGKPATSTARERLLRD